MVLLLENARGFVQEYPVPRREKSGKERLLVSRAIENSTNVGRAVPGWGNTPCVSNNVGKVYMLQVSLKTPLTS